MRWAVIGLYILFKKIDGQQVAYIVSQNDTAALVFWHLDKKRVDYSDSKRFFTVYYS
ncbi:hypothetical protein KUL42_04790 [Alteromonas sp. KUL42]|nr:hypothetical protein KUL42_04790 [Alteromonas sp. KUL42]